MSVALSGQFVPELRARLARDHEVVELGQVLSTARAAEVSVLVTRGALYVDQVLLDGLPKLQKIVKAGSGLDTIDLVAARERRVEVVATGGSAESVADLAMALLFSCLRCVPVLDDAVRRGAWDQKAAVVGETLASRKVGIVGFGQIGRQFARNCRALGAEVFAWDRSIERAEKQAFASAHSVMLCTTLIDLIHRSDVISLHLPLAADTASLVGKREFAAMNRGTILINTARAHIVDRGALIAALGDGALSAAGLDVHYNEGQQTPEPLFALPNVVLTPHVGAQTHQARQNIAERIIAELSAAEAQV